LETFPEMTPQLATIVGYVNSMSLSSRGVIFLPVREEGRREPAKISSFFLTLSLSFLSRFPECATSKLLFTKTI